LVARVVGVVEAPGIGLDLPLDVRCTAFQQRVWTALNLSEAKSARRPNEKPATGSRAHNVTLSLPSCVVVASLDLAQRQ
jgi:hypothetical protein